MELKLQDQTVQSNIYHKLHKRIKNNEKKNLEEDSDLYFTVQGNISGL